MSQREDHESIMRGTLTEVDRLLFMTGAVTALSVAWNGSNVTFI